MKLIADSKRRVVLPRPNEPGDVFDYIETGDRLVLVRMQMPRKQIPLWRDGLFRGRS